MKMPRFLPGLLLAVVIAGIAAATLRSGGGSSDPSFFCILCGTQREVADLISNILMFLPFGVALGMRATPIGYAALAGALFSGVIEISQVELISGRDASLRDLVANTAGTVIGCAFWRARPWRLARRGGPLPVVALAAAGTAILLFGLAMLRPITLEPRYRMQWTPEWENHDHYRGTVLSARLGALEWTEGNTWMDPGDQVAALLGSEPLRVRFIAGPPTRGLAPIVSIHSRGIEFVLIGVLGTDFLYRYWGYADEARLDHLNLQLAGRMALFQPGDTVDMAFQLTTRGYCLELNGAVECGRGFSVGDVWTVLISPDWARFGMTAAGMVWLWGVFLPAGFLSRNARTLAFAGVALVAFLLLAPLAIGFAPTPWYHVAAALAGAATGFALAGRLRAIEGSARGG